MDARDVRHASEFMREREEEHRENSLFRHAIRTAVAAAAAKALFSRRGA